MVRFLFCFSGVFIVVPVHVRKRKERLKPATAAHFLCLGRMITGARIKQKSRHAVGA